MPAAQLARPTINELRKLIAERPDTIRRDGVMIESRRNLRDFEHDEKKICGYAIVWNSLSEDLGYFREKVSPTACDKDLQANSDVRALNNHNTGEVLGRRSAGTLRLSKDSTGLAVEIDIPDTTFGNNLRVSMGRRDVTQFSFGFLVREDGDTFERCTFDENNPDKWGYLRTLLDIQLIEVSPVSIPAYSATSAYLRSAQKFREADNKRIREIMIRDRQIQMLNMRRR